jgi:hypothetical protein
MNSLLYRRKDARQRAMKEIVRKMELENFTTEDAKQKNQKFNSDLPAGVT